MDARAESAGHDLFSIMRHRLGKHRHFYLLLMFNICFSSLQFVMLDAELQPPAYTGTVFLVLAAKSISERLLFRSDLKPIEICDKKRNRYKCREVGQVYCPGCQHEQQP